MFEIIDDLKKKLDQYRPLSPAIVKNLQEDLIVRWTYHVILLHYWKPK